MIRTSSQLMLLPTTPCVELSVCRRDRVDLHTRLQPPVKRFQNSEVRYNYGTYKVPTLARILGSTLFRSPPNRTMVLNSLRWPSMSAIGAGLRDLPVLMFCGKTKVALGGAKAAPSKKCNSRDKKDGCLVYTEPCWAIPEMELSRITLVIRICFAGVGGNIT